MKINKSVLITDTFKCPLFAFNNATLSFKACIGRQVSKLVRGGMMYPDCVDCKDGQEIKKHFKNYKNKKPVKPVNTFKSEKTKHLKKGDSPFSPQFTETSKNHKQGSQMERHQPHKLDIGGSSPPPAIKFKQTLWDLELLLKAQISYLFSLIHEDEFDKALRRIKLLNKELEIHEPK